MTPSNQVEDLIKQVIEPIVSHKYSIANPSKIADDVYRLIDPEHLAPALAVNEALTSIKQRARLVLARDYDPVKRQEEAIKHNNQPDMFGGVLQDRYPTKRMVSGEKTCVYVSRELLSDEELLAQADRMDKGSKGLGKHADAVRAYVAARSKSKAS